MVRVVAFFLLTYKGSCSSPVVAVSNVESWNTCKNIGNCSNVLLVVDYPEFVAETVNRCYVIVLYLFCADGSLNYLVDLCVVGISKEHWLKVGILVPYVDHSVFLLVLAGELVLFDFAGHVILYVCTYYKAVLCASVHCLCVNIVILFWILNKPAFLLPQFEVLNSFVISCLAVLVCYRIKVNLRFDDM